MAATLYYHDGCPLIDTRALDSPALLARHILGCASLPAASWADRALELPPRCTRFSLLCDSSADCAALVASLGVGSPGQVLGQDLHAVYLDSAEFWDTVPQALLLAGRWEARHQGRLWRPGPLTALLAACWGGWGLPCGGSPAAVLDAGCGQGRNAVFLLQALGASGALPRLAVVGVDNRTAMVDKFVRFAVRALEGCTPPVRIAAAGAAFSERTTALLQGTWAAAGQAQPVQQLSVFGVKRDILEYLVGGEEEGGGGCGAVGGSAAWAG